MDDVAKVKQKIDVVELIESYIPLKKAGRNFKTACPFHNEKSASFVVSPDRQIWHCFGCQKGGDIFTFVEEYEKTTFSDALKFLAQKAGIKLTVSEARTEADRKRDLIYTLNSMAAKYYEYILFSHKAGVEARAYVLEKRKQPEALLKLFQVGYAPESGYALVDYLTKKKNYNPQDLVDAGLAFRQGSRVVDFFRNRIMFPITDPRGNIIAFSGRALDNTTMPKYVNTKETLLYKKGETVFGLHLARDEIKKQGSVILMEGEFDVISSHREGIGNTVAVKGTALTPEQIDLLRRYSQKLIFCFDTDSAGTSAQRRSIELIEKAGVAASVIVLPTGKDPDELLSTDPIAFKQAVKKDVHMYDFIIDSAVTQFDSSTVDGKRDILLKTVPYLSVIDNEVIKEHYIKKLAEKLGTSAESVVKQVNKEKKEIKVERTLKGVSKPKEDILSSYFFSLLLSSSNLIEDVRLADTVMDSVELPNPAYQKLFVLLKQYVESGNTSLEGFATTIPSELIEKYDTAFIAPISEFDLKTLPLEIKKAALQAKKHFIQNRLASITSEIETLEKTGNTQDISVLQEEASALTQKLYAAS